MLLLSPYSSLSSPIEISDLHSFPTRRSSDLRERRHREKEERRQRKHSHHHHHHRHHHLHGRRDHDRSEEHTSELQSHSDLVCRLLLEKKKDHICRAPRSPVKTITRAARLSPR